MGSMAQDERHERILREAKEEVADLERQVEVKRNELAELERKLSSARADLSLSKSIDATRD
jgi:predicted RNase H-like nuclease (RuvC/YqgF family)